jgi:hypothetical protein
MMSIPKYRKNSRQQWLSKDDGRSETFQQSKSIRMAKDYI